MEGKVQKQIDTQKDVILCLQIESKLLAGDASLNWQDLNRPDLALADLALQAILHPLSLSSGSSLILVFEVLLQTVGVYELNGALAGTGTNENLSLFIFEADAALLLARATHKLTLCHCLIIFS
jgi:hypothetical protein